jgi:hypothetical protein
MIDPRSRTMVLRMAWATLHIGEAIGLRRSDLDLRTGRLRVANNVVEVSGRLHEGPPKTNAGRRAMTLPPSVVAELRFHVARFGGVVTSSPGQVAVSFLRRSGGPTCGNLQSPRPDSRRFARTT